MPAPFGALPREESTLSRVAIFTDSASDFDPAQAAAEGISIVPLLVTFGSETFKAGVDLSQATAGNPVVGATGVTAIPITMSLTGTYFALDEYLFQLETLPRAAKVISVTLAPAGTGATTVSGTLTMQVTMELYTTDISAGPGSDPGPTEGEAPGVVAPVAPVAPVASPSATG